MILETHYEFLKCIHIFWSGVHSMNFLNLVILFSTCIVILPLDIDISFSGYDY